MTKQNKTKKNLGSRDRNKVYSNNQRPASELSILGLCSKLRVTKENTTLHNVNIIKNTLQKPIPNNSEYMLITLP